MTSTYQPRVNSGTLINNYNKTAETHADFKGSIYIDKDLLIELVKNRTSELIEVKLAGWKKLDKNGKPCVSLQVDTWKPQERQDAPEQSQKDPWEQ